jgi:hypothetical protein
MTLTKLSKLGQPPSQKDLTQMSLLIVTLALADFTISTKALVRMTGVSLLVRNIMDGTLVSLLEIDEALAHAYRTRNSEAFSQRQRDIVDSFINDLLDSRLELTKC